MESLLHSISYKENLETWLKGVNSEVAFWNHIFATKGGNWPEDFQRRTAPEVNFLFKDKKLVNNRIDVLDVGAGPISVVGSKISEGNFINLTSCDLLAPAYKILLNHHNIKPYCLTQYAVLEFLALFFHESSFDIVTMINSLDHCFNPVQGIMQLLYIVKIGGSIILNHNRNEAENENYVGLHQWNIDYDNKKSFIIRNMRENYNITELFSDFCDISIDIYTNAMIKFGEYLHIELIKKRDIQLPKMDNFPIMCELLAKNSYLYLSPILRDYDVENCLKGKIE